jgi:hypothetical protein
MMRWLLFLSRLALICNVFFLLAVSLQVSRWLQNNDAESTIFILGFLMAALLNPTINLCYLFLFFVNRINLRVVPQWIVLFNIAFLLFQIIYIIYRNGR